MAIKIPSYDSSRKVKIIKLMWLSNIFKLPLETAVEFRLP